MKLSAEDWVKVNEAIKNIYTEGNERQVRKNIMDAIHSLIYYDFGDFCYTTRDGLVSPVTDPVVKTRLSKAFQQEYEHAYQSIYSRMDYTKWCFSSNESVVFRESDIFDNSARSKTKYFTEFLQPRDMIYSIGCFIITKNPQVLPGTITLYRGHEQGDFSEAELEILKTLLPHIEKGMSLFAAHEQADADPINAADLKLINTYQLTRREISIVKELIKGSTNSEIAQDLNISVYTVKKHISNILSKTNTANRIKLLQLISSIDG